MTTVPRTLTIAAAAGSGLMAGVFFAFSTFVMPALRRLPDVQGVSAMQAINRAAPASAPFMALLGGTALICVGLGISAVTRIDTAAARYQLAGCGLYLLCIVITGAYHVPHNDALGLLDPTAGGTAQAWHHYLTGWTAWNHVRVLAPAAATVAFLLALREA